MDAGAAIAYGKVNRSAAGAQPCGRKTVVANSKGTGWLGKGLVFVPGAADGEGVAGSYLQGRCYGGATAKRSYYQGLVGYIGNGVALRINKDAVVGKAGVGMSAGGVEGEKPFIGYSPLIVKGSKKGKDSTAAVVERGIVPKAKVSNTCHTSNGDGGGIGEAATYIVQASSC